MNFSVKVPTALPRASKIEVPDVVITEAIDVVSTVAEKAAENGLEDVEVLPTDDEQIGDQAIFEVTGSSGQLAGDIAQVIQDVAEGDVDATKVVEDLAAVLEDVIEIAQELAEEEQNEKKDGKPDEDGSTLAESIGQLAGDLTEIIQDIAEGDVDAAKLAEDIATVVTDAIEVVQDLQEEKESEKEEAEADTTNNEQEHASAQHDDDDKPTQDEVDKEVHHEDDVKEVHHEDDVKEVHHEDDVKEAHHEVDVKDVHHEDDVKEVHHEDDTSSDEDEEEEEVQYRHTIDASNQVDVDVDVQADVGKDGEQPSVAQLIAWAKSNSKSNPQPVASAKSMPNRASENFQALVDESQRVHQSEKGASNEEVLSKLVDEVDEADRPNVAKLLAWAKGTRKPKTETTKIREKKKTASLMKAVDVNSLPVVIEDKKADTIKVVKSSQRAFKVTNQHSVPSINTIFKQTPEQTSASSLVSEAWVKKVIQLNEDVEDVTILSLHTTKNANGTHSANIKAKVEASERTYDLILKNAPLKNQTDKDSFLMFDLGAKLRRFSISNGKTLKKDFPFPVSSSIFTDQQFAVFEDLGAFRTIASDNGLSMDCLKLGLKALARLHAASYAYFIKSEKGKDELAAAQKIVIDNKLADKAAMTETLSKYFDNLLNLLRSVGPNGVALADKAKARFGDTRLFDIFRNALSPISNFSVLCHGFPVQENFIFRLDGEKPEEVRLVNFEHSRFAHAITDVAIMLSTCLGPKVEEQSGFLLRFVYYETLAASLKAYGVDHKLDFDVIKKDFKSKQVYGALAGAMHLAKNSGNVVIRSGGAGNRASGKRVFTSKLIGSYSSSIQVASEETIEASPLALRVFALIEKIVTEY